MTGSGLHRVCGAKGRSFASLGGTGVALRMAAMAVSVAGTMCGTIACHRSTHDVEASSTPVTPADTTIRGTVRVSGAVPEVQTTIKPVDGSREIRILGPLAPDVESISGVTIAATGQPVANILPVPPRALMLRSFEVVGIEDLVAFDGTLMRRGASILLATIRDTLELRAPVPAALQNLVGKRVYVAGAINNRVLSVTSFGAIGRRQP